MSLFNIGDRVTLAPARGGYQAFVVARAGGPGGKPLYLVQSPRSGDLDEGLALVAEADIASGPGAVPTFAVGEVVSLYGKAATVTVDHGDATYDLAVDWFPGRHLTLTRAHVAVPAWRIAVENGG